MRAAWQLAGVISSSHARAKAAIVFWFAERGAWASAAKMLAGLAAAATPASAAGLGSAVGASVGNTRGVAWLSATSRVFAAPSRFVRGASPNRFSTVARTELWSNTVAGLSGASPMIVPLAVYAETTMAGTRTPNRLNGKE